MTHRRPPLDWAEINRADAAERRRQYLAEYYRRNRDKKLAAAKKRQKEGRTWEKTDRSAYFRKRYLAKKAAFARG